MKTKEKDTEYTNSGKKYKGVYLNILLYIDEIAQTLLSIILFLSLELHNL